MKILFRCDKCQYNWKEDKPKQVVCPLCNHSYVKWLNFEEWRKKHMFYPYN